MTVTSQADLYREQLTRLVESLGLGRTEEARQDLAAGCREQSLPLYAGGAVEKRRKKLERQLEFLGEALEDLAELLQEYVGSVHAPAYEAGPDDGLQFLDWLDHRLLHTPEQRDFLACQRARLLVETEARVHRAGHVRFQELWSVAGRLTEELELNPHLMIHLNPVRVRSRFATCALLEDGFATPADVLFFPVQRSVATAVLEADGLALLNELEGLAPCTLNTWSCVSVHSDRDRLVEFVRDLAELGLIAFA